MPEVMRQMQRERELSSATSSAPPPPATDPDQQRGLKRLPDIQLETTQINKAALEKRMQAQIEDSAAGNAEWNMRRTSAQQQL